MCQSGKLTDEVTGKFKEAIDFLEKKGVSGITGDCGFYMWFQARPLLSAFSRFGS